MLLFFQSSGLCVQSPSIIPVPGYPLCLVSWSTSELRVRLAPLNRFKPSSKIFYWPFQGGTSFVDLLCFCSVLCLLCFVLVCLYVLCGHLLGKGWPLGSRLWCLLWVCHFPIGILGQVWYLIVSILDLCTITYFWKYFKVTVLFLYARASLMSLIELPSSEINDNIHMPALWQLWNLPPNRKLPINMTPPS